MWSGKICNAKGESSVKSAIFQPTFWTLFELRQTSVDGLTGRGRGEEEKTRTKSRYRGGEGCAVLIDRGKRLVKGEGEDQD